MVETTELETETLSQGDLDIKDSHGDQEDELARPALTIKEASYLLGRSARALERSIQGRWGNKLPDGWVAKKINIDGNDEWRIIPPDSFKVRHRAKDDEIGKDTEGEDLIPNLLEEALNLTLNLPSSKSKEGFVIKRSLADEGLDNSTIIIDRSEEVELLLKELVKVHKALADETRLHVEDLRMLNEMTNSCRLLETNQSKTQMLKEELVSAQRELIAFKHQYEEYLSLPWWKRLLRRFP